MINLDYYCMKHGQKIGDYASEGNLRKALGILVEDGVYAMFLWLEYKDRKIRLEGLWPLLNNEDQIRDQFIGKNGFAQTFDGFCSNLQEIAKDLNKLFFLKKILERTLTYARYHAKVRGEVS